MSLEVSKEAIQETAPAPVENTGTPAPESAPASAPEAKDEPVSPGDSGDGEGVVGEGGEGEPAAAAAYKPREKFKFLDFGTGEQKEETVPEWLKATMKDEATEKEAIALLEKAYGLEPVKASRAAVAQERDRVKTELGSVQKTIQDVRQTYQRGDIDAFLDKLVIPHERMLQWALDKVNYSQLPPDQQRVLDERTEAQRKAWAAEQQSGMLEQQVHEQTRQAKQVLLQSSFARPDVKSFADSYDARAGKPGAFFEEVRATGELAYIQSQGKNDLTPDQAIELVMKKWSPFISPAQASGNPATPAPGQDPNAARVVNPSQKPGVIPNLQGKAASPMKSGVRSLDDIRKIAAQKNA